ncbi:unnamed protein product (macronuclear) [Paramecium tetraurelia]|uniref:HSF-type DNA-binding domain-containing protein n=1 Tax=Paramecium tetraurelia TaxID=5888 RepID=A0CTK2_PARTE|nr:uncharacterized protein GSPATT00010353001 [Paramecium tetraurelia]CAK74119.1 unnamed protein product [Paramecium tetraurelia]|eukprot:XP_001441516.1 hypothetical protein (macronuclear) [Paramecium tetraurelia strain d4-2]
MHRKNKQRTVIKFIEVTHQMLNQNEFQDIIRWDEDGVKIQILDRELLQELVLPKYFKHAKYSSFLRQLNMYGFTSSKDQYGALTYYNPCFAKQKVLMRNIVKKKHQKQIIRDSSIFGAEQSELNNQIKALQFEQVKIQQNLLSSIEYQIKIKNSIQLFLKNKLSLAREGEKNCRLFIDSVRILVKGMKFESQNAFQVLFKQVFPQFKQEDPQQIQIISEIEEQSNQYLFSPTPFGKFDYDQEEMSFPQMPQELEFSGFGFEL